MRILSSGGDGMRESGPRGSERGERSVVIKIKKKQRL